MQEGLILKSIGGFYYIKSDTEIYECKPRGIFRKEKIIPLVGDKVKISVTNKELKKGIIEEICPRKTVLVRPPIANVNQVILVFAVKTPEPDFLLLDKMLVKISSLDIDITICVNKIDLDENYELKNVFKIYSSIGYPVIFMSAFKGEKINELKQLLGGKLSILAGSSGVGKSTIINKLNLDARVKTGDLSKRVERGKHTTRHVEFFQIVKDGYLADTPGFSSFNIDDIKYNELKDYYLEFEKYYKNCKFSGCNHICEPSCTVKEAVESGIIDVGRYERYKQLFNYLKQKERYKF